MNQLFNGAMKTILQINSSLFSAQGASSRLAHEFVAAIAARSPTRVIARDLVREPLPHLDVERFAAIAGKADDPLIEELRAADVLVIGLPMYNFGVPSQLKAWFDHVARAGVTFRYRPDGSSEGLLTGKKAYVFAARGGKYADTPDDLQTRYVRLFLGFLGITDVEFVYAEGLALGEAAREAGLAGARACIEALAPRVPLAA